MTKILKTVPILFILVLLVSSTISLSAQTADQTEGCAPLTVQFAAPGSSSTFYWDFDDGGTSVIKNPSHTFTQVKTYVVKFKESQNGSVVGTISIQIYPKPIPFFTADPQSGCQPLDVAFKDSSNVASQITVTNYSWVFGDGGGDSGTPNPTHTYITSGSFTAGLQLVTDKPGCDTTIAVADFIKVSNPPSPTFITTPNPPVACNPPLNVSFTNTTPPGAYVFHWDFGGSTYDGVTPPPQTYTQDGSYPVTLSVSDDNGCVKEKTISIGVGSPKPSFTLDNDTLCKSVIYTAINTSPIGTYQWEFGPDATPTTSTQVSPNFRFNTGGTKTIKLTLTSPDGQCMGDTTVTIFVEDPVAMATVSPDYSCSEPVMLDFTGTSSGIASWEYIFSDGMTSSEQNPSHLYVDYDTTTYSLEGLTVDTTILKVTTAAGCMGFGVITANIYTPNALFLPDVKDGCAPLTVNFEDKSISQENIVSWHWDFGDGSTLDATNDNTIPHTYTQPGEYPVQLIIVNSGGCRDTSYIQTIFVGEPITLDFSVDKTDICPGDTVHFMDLSNNANIDAYHYYSDGDRLTHCASDGNPAWTFHETGSQDVTLEAIYNGCHSTLTKPGLINVHGPIAKINYNMACESPFDFNFTSLAEDADSIFWDFGDGTDTMMVSTITHTYADTGDYTIILRSTNNTSGCEESSDTVQIHVRDIKASFTIPPKVCKGADLMLDASASQDVNGICYKGYQWNSSEKRPITVGTPVLPFEFSFGGSGDQWVELIVDDVNGCRDTLRQYTRVFGAEAKIFPSDTLICLPNSIDFTSITSGDTTLASWEWDFGDNQTGMGQNITHNFALPNPADNIFKVSLTVKDVLGCEGMDTALVNIYEPTSTITTIPTPPFICIGETVNFSATDFTTQGSHLNFNWDFGNGTTSNNQTGSATYNTAGSFPAVLSFTEAATGCAGSTQVEVKVQDYPTAAFSSSVDGQSVLCYPINIEFIDQSSPSTGLSYFWDFGNGGNAVGDTVVAVFGKGTFDVSHVVATSFGCTDTITKPINTTGPEGDFTLDKTTICLGENITATINPADTVDVGSFHFDFGDGTLIHDQLTATHAYTFLPGSNQQPIKLVLTSVDGSCSFTAEKIVTILNTQAEFTNSSGTLTGCEAENFTFVNQSIDANQFEWDFGDGTPTSNLESPTHVFTGAGTYQVTLTASNTGSNCVSTVTHSVTILPEIPVSTDDVSICQGDTATLQVNNPQTNYSYSWSPTNLVGMPNSSSTTAFPSVTTNFIVTASDTSGCTGMDTATVFVVTPIPNITFDTTIFAGTTINLPVEYNPPYVFSWNPTDGLSCLVCSNPSVTPTEDITYGLSITDDAACFTSTGLFVIHIFPEDIDIPNAFTPNNDGTNDFFNVIITDDVASLLEVTDFRIYDRWGQKVYDNDNKSKGWDGKYKNKELPSDVYPYIVEVTFLNGKKKTLKGTVTLLR